jgi:lysophospholipase L1-like esterase
MFSRRMFYWLLITICLLLTLEAGTRLAFSVYSDINPKNDNGGLKENILSSDLGWDRRPNFNGFDDCGVHRAFDNRGFRLADAAQLKMGASNRHRVLFLGDSNTYGYCVATEASFVEVADRLLPNYDLINLGIPGYTSYQGYKELLKYGESIKPEIIFISFNFNDRRYVINDEDRDGDATFRKIGTISATRLIEYSHLFRVIRTLGRKSGVIRPSIEDSAVRADRLKPRVGPKSYKTNLIRMVEWSRTHGATPYLVLLGDNPSQTALLRQGIRKLEQNDNDGAIDDLTRVASYSQSAVGPLARKYLAMAYGRTGQKDKALQAATFRPIYTLHGGAPIFQDVVYKQIMRDVAGEYGVELIDAESKLDETPRVYFDICHFDAEGHEIVGKLIGEVLHNEFDRNLSNSNTLVGKGH